MNRKITGSGSEIAEATLADGRQPAATGLGARLDGAIDRANALQRIVGTVVLVARDGQLVYRRAAGLADREAGRPMREDAIFRLSSAAKPIVTAAAMRLVEEGRLHPSDPVTRWLPNVHPKAEDGTLRRPSEAGEDDEQVF